MSDKQVDVAGTLGTVVRPASLLNRDLSQGLFPFEAFTFDPEQTASPSLTLNSPWSLVANIPAITALLATKAPLPQSAGGVGTVSTIAVGPNVAAVLPAGGTWWYFRLGFNSTTFVLNTGAVSTTAAGGTTVGGSGATQLWEGWWYEIMGPGSFDSSQPVNVRPDGSFVVTKGKHRFHVLSEALADEYGITDPDFRREVTELYAEVKAYVEAHPECVQPEPEPQAVKIDPDMQLASEIMADYIEQQRTAKKWQDRKAALVTGNKP